MGPACAAPAGERQTSVPLKDERGFTLVELLIVIIVLGILAAIVVLSVGSTKQQANRAVCITRVGSVKQSAEGVQARTSAFPIGTFRDSSSPNPLVAPEPGALLRVWPPDDGFVVEYNSDNGTSFAVNVYEADGATLVPGGCAGL